jgi:hypothetical protein
VRLQFYKEDKKYFFVDVPTKIMALIGRAAKEAQMNAGQFVFTNIGSMLAEMDEKIHWQGRETT